MCVHEDSLQMLAVPEFCLQLVEQHNAVKLLEEIMADASNPERIRALPGRDPTCQELREKLELLQVFCLGWWQMTRQLS